MALQLPALPNFQTNIPQADPLATYGKLLQLKALQGQQALLPLQIQSEQERNQLLQQQTQAAQTQNQVAQIDLASKQAYAEYWKNPDKYQSDPSDYKHNDALAGMLGIDPSDPLLANVRGQIKAGVDPAHAIADASHTLQVRQEWSKATQEQQNVLKTSFEQLREISAPILAEKDANKKQALIDAAAPGLARWASFDPSLKAVVPQLNAGNFDVFANRIGAEKDALGVIEQGGKAAEAQQKVINPATGMSPQQTSELTKEQAEMPMKEKLVRDEAIAREQVQASMLPLLEQIRQQFGNQKDARDKIETNVVKPFQEKMTDVNMARSAIAQAQDNPVAARAAIFKMVGVAQPTGSHRVIPAEIAAFKYPGGITDQVKEKFNDFLKGEPWTPEVAQAASAFIDGQAQSAQTSLNAGIDNTNKLYGTSVGSGLKQEVKAPSGPPPGATHIVPGKDGKNHYTNATGTVDLGIAP